MVPWERPIREIWRLRAGGLDEPAEVLGLAEVEVTHLPVDAGTDQLPHRDALCRHVQREASIVIIAEAESRFVPDLQRRRHRHTPSSKPSGNVYEAYGLLHARTRGKSIETARIRESRDARAHTDACQACSAYSPFDDALGRSHGGTWTGCIVSLALHTDPPFSAGWPSSTYRSADAVWPSPRSRLADRARDVGRSVAPAGPARASLPSARSLFRCTGVVHLRTGSTRIAGAQPNVRGRTYRDRSLRDSPTAWDLGVSRRGLWRGSRRRGCGIRRLCRPGSPAGW